MASKLTDLFAASRFVLPEHRAAYLEMRRDECLVPKPELAEDELTELHYRVLDAQQYDQALTVRWWHPVKNDLGEIRELWGWIKKIDTTGGRIKLGNDEEAVWLDVDMIIEVTS